MTIMLDFATLDGVLSMSDAIDLLEEASRHEAAGKTVIAPRTNLDFASGSMRLLFAVDYHTGYFASKAYNRIQGAGVRYVISLYRLKDGELLALLDGRSITDLRTGAASGVVARKVTVRGPVSVGIIGSGNQARAQLASLAAAYEIVSAAVYSPSLEHRERYAREVSAQLGIGVTAVASAEEAARRRSVVVTATRSKSSEPVVRGEWLPDCRLLCAVGNTRKQFSEADVRCFSEARLVVVDALHAFEETGELILAGKSGAVPEAKRATLAQVVSGTIDVPDTGLIAFKSVGTALQDLALAAKCYELLQDRAGIPRIENFAGLR